MSWLKRTLNNSFGEISLLPLTLDGFLISHARFMRSSRAINIASTSMALKAAREIDEMRFYDNRREEGS
jgi:NifU-like protein involved in Fe-S cluster formation